MIFGRKTAAAILSLIMIITMLPVASFAEDGNDVSGGSDSGFEDFAYQEGIGPDGIKYGEAEKLME